MYAHIIMLKENMIFVESFDIYILFKYLVSQKRQNMI